MTASTRSQVGTLVPQLYPAGTMPLVWRTCPCVIDFPLPPMNSTNACIALAEMEVSGCCCAF